MSAGLDYVAVLIDGNALNFQSELLQAGSRGGQTATDRLNEAVHQYIRNTDGIPEINRTVVMIFGDMLNISMKAVEANVIGKMGALVAFAASFNAAQPSFSFVNCAHINTSMSKVRAHLDIFASDPNCKHIILGTGGFPSNQDLIKSIAAHEENLTLLYAQKVPFGYEKLNLKKVKFENIFQGEFGAMKIPQDLEQVGKTIEVGKAPVRKAHEMFLEESYTNKGTKLCYHFAEKGICRNKQCKFEHVPILDNPYQLPVAPPPDAAHICVPVNKQNERIDLLVRPPTEAEWAEFNARVKVKPVCAYYHLTGNPCERANYECEKDHEPISAGVLHALRYKFSEAVCKERGGCRWPECYKAHHCQRYSCFWGPSHKCKMSPSMHQVSKKVDSWEKVRGTGKSSIPLEYLPTAPPAAAFVPTYREDLLD